MGPMWGSLLESPGVWHCTLCFPHPLPLGVLEGGRLTGEPRDGPIAGVPPPITCRGVTSRLILTIFSRCFPLDSSFPEGERGGYERKNKWTPTSFTALQARLPAHTHRHTYTLRLRFFLQWNQILKGKTILAVFWLSCSKELRCLNSKFSCGCKIWYCRSVPCGKLGAFPGFFFSPCKETERFRPHCEGPCGKEII